MAANLLIPPELVFFDAQGQPLAGGQLATYVPGTLQQKFTYQDANETILNSDPIILDVRGACTAYADGDVRLILTDAAGNQVFDLVSSEPLPASAIGAVLPCLGSQTLGAFRDCAGITAAIQSAVSNVTLMPGPVGPTGPKGDVGPAGATGPAGSSPFTVGAGYIVFGQYGSAPIFQSGTAQSDASGFGTVNFPLGMANATLSVLCTPINDIGFWVTVSSLSTGGFQVRTSSPLIGGDWYGGPLLFSWLAIGY